MTKEQRDELYNKQPGEMVFVRSDFTCRYCKKDILKNGMVRVQAEEGKLITGCPFCHRSFCE